MEPSHRSVYPNLPGVPWWAALLTAVSATALGYAIDAGSGHKELTHIFAGFYIAGCLAAVLAVRQDGVFTAIIQPPLILFCAVPGAYYLFHGGNIGKLKDLLINCGYPLIERFPLMLGTAGGVLLIGLIRWYFGMSQRTVNTDEAPDGTATPTAGGATSLIGSAAAKLQSFLRSGNGGNDPEHDTTRDGRRRRPAGASARSRTARSSRSTARSGRVDSGRSRRPLDGEAAADRPRRSTRRRPQDERYDAAEPSRRSPRRPRPDADPDGRRDPRRERREPRTRRSPYERPTERPTPRSGRFDGYDMYEPPRAPDHFGRYERFEDRYEPAHDQGRRSATTSGAGSTHHPISQVRYRGGAAADDARSEPNGEGRPRTSPSPRAKSWEYDG
ncbi:hypothetical protein MPRM_00480 [Mycobacterium parmense]|uniref:Uncharacterized protein n=1 Tax=Mycobacterium parmense TaxID=185642 RepID=A0A7I7YN63_9MYCO|nr:hypothetical protein AWC20_14380 [Mycobacterium parmense]BBZ42767.1 hypothetical protein MPRM_00480 [Mycobacterium parmense]